MKVLALTHAHLSPDGLSPVSCERADSVVGAWGEKLNWDIDVVHTKHSKWRGIWPDGSGLKIHILNEEAPVVLLMEAPQLFSVDLKAKLQKKQFAGAAALFADRITKHIRRVFAGKGFALPHQIAVAAKWGAYLSTLKSINSKRYDFIFVCAGYGDEYLLQTALTLSETLHVPVVADLRDLWSEHHDPGRLTGKQKKQIRRLEKKLLAKAVLISAPQQHMVRLLNKWAPCPVYLLPHSAYIDKGWEDGKVVNNEFIMLYAGKLYAAGPGLNMLLELIRKLSAMQLYKPFMCRFFVDDTVMLEQLAATYNIADHVQINGWVSPGELWKNLRSAHLLLVPDPGVAENYPFIPTKTFQFAYTGRQILCLQQYKNEEMQEFLHKFNAGMVYTNIEEAAKWVTKLSFEKSQYEQLPALRNIQQRGQAGEDFGKEIKKIIAHR